MKDFMKTLNQILVLGLIVAGTSAYAQTPQSGAITIPLSTPGKIGTLEVNLIAGSITVKGTSTKDVQVTINTEKDDDDDDNTSHNGMKRLNVSGGDIEAKESNNAVSIHGSSGDKTSSLEISVPANFNLKLHTINDGDIEVSGVSGEIEAENVNGGIKLENISGSVSANTVNGDVVVTMSDVTPGTPMAFSTLNGDVDVTVPATLKGNVKMKSDQGDIYTDFDIAVASNSQVQTSKDDGVYKVKIEKWVEGTINGGGPQILMKNMNGDLYLRKKK